VDGVSRRGPDGEGHRAGGWEGHRIKLTALSVTVSVRGGVARSSEAARGSGHGVRDKSPPQLLSRKYCGALLIRSRQVAC
jgi:hypothetical protein